MNNLDEFITLNNINKDQLMDALHYDIRELLLKTICERLKSDKELYLKIRKLYFTHDDLVATKKVVLFICKCQLSNEDFLWMNDCLKAFINKKDTRKAIPGELKKQLCDKQDNKCAICGRSLESVNSHVDHIIPWDYVGDELKNNYQVLCSDCNLHKSNHVAITVSNIILNKQGGLL